MYYSPFLLIVYLLLLLQVSCQSLSSYSTFDNIGLELKIPSSYDPGQAGTCIPYYREYLSSDPYVEGHIMTRTDSLRFVGSLFWLKQGTQYSIKVNCSGTPSLAALEENIVDAVRAELIQPVPLRYLYISPDGNGTACTSADPCSLETVSSIIKAGDQVVMRSGTYYESVSFSNIVGNLTHPVEIVCESYLGCVMDGRTRKKLTWTHSGGLYQTDLEFNTNLVIVDGERLFPYYNSIDFDNDAYGPGFLCESNILTMKINPLGHWVVIGELSEGFIFYYSDHVNIRNIKFQFYGSSGYPKAIYLYNTSNTWIKDCYFYINDRSIGLKYESHGQLFENNTFSDSRFHLPWVGIKGGTSLEAGSIVFYGSSELTGRGLVIRNNIIYDYFDGMNVCDLNTYDSTRPTNEIDIHNNLFMKCGDDTLEIDGQGVNVRIYHNVFRDSLVGFSMAPSLGGPAYLYYNLFFNTGRSVSSYSGMTVKFNSGYDPSGEMFIYQNTAFGNYSNSGFTIHNPSAWKLIKTRNNIFMSNDYALYNVNPNYPMDFDFDGLNCLATNELVYWDAGGERHYRTLSDVQSQLGIELSGSEGDPGFKDCVSQEPDFSLVYNSSFIDKGTIIAGLNVYGENYIGSAPDLGCFEFGMNMWTVPHLILNETASSSQSYSISSCPHVSLHVGALFWILVTIGYTLLL